MKTILRILLFILSVILLPTAQLHASDYDAGQTKRIWLIESYDSDFPTYKHVRKALDEFLDSTNYALDIEFMDTKEFNDTTYIAHFKELISYKKKTLRPYDLVIAGNDNALHFVLNNQETLFRNLPIVFYGINDIELAKAQNNNPMVTGITEQLSIKETLEFAKLLDPELEEIVAIYDNTTTGQTDLQTFLSMRDSIEPLKLSAINTGDFTFHDLQKVISRYNGKKAFLLISAYKDRNNNYLSFEQALHLISSNTKIPIYHLYTHGLDRGVLGGKLVHHRDLARTALKIAYRVLHDGEPIQKIPVIETCYNSYFADYKQMQNFEYDITRLPKETQLINQPSPFFKIDKQFVYLFIAAFALAILSLILTTYFLQRRKHMQHELIAAKEKAQESERLKSAFLANISHEIRTPMNAILGFSELLREQQIPDDERKHFIEIINNQGQQLLRLLTNVLEMSHLEAGPTSLHIQPIEMNKLFSELEKEYKTSLAESGKGHIEFIVQADEQISFVESDEMRLHQIITNLVNNAMKFTDSGFIEIGYSLSDNKETINFYVKDSGVGIPMSKLKNIFERFVQISHTTVGRNVSGVGLGLAIAKHLVNLLDGTIWADSEEGKGTTIFFALPNREEENAQAKRKREYFS